MTAVNSRINGCHIIQSTPLAVAIGRLGRLAGGGAAYLFVTRVKKRGSCFGGTQEVINVPLQDAPMTSTASRGDAHPHAHMPHGNTRQTRA